MYNRTHMEPISPWGEEGIQPARRTETKGSAFEGRGIKLRVNRPSLQRIFKEAPIKLQPRMGQYTKLLTQNSKKYISNEFFKVEQKNILPPLFIESLRNKIQPTKPILLKKRNFQSTHNLVKNIQKIDLNKSLIQKCSLKNIQLFQMPNKKYSIQNIAVKKLLKASKQQNHILDRMLQRFQ